MYSSRCTNYGFEIVCHARQQGCEYRQHGYPSHGLGCRGSWLDFLTCIYHMNSCFKPARFLALTLRLTRLHPEFGGSVHGTTHTQNFKSKVVRFMVSVFFHEVSLGCCCRKVLASNIGLISACGLCVLRINTRGFLKWGYPKMDGL